MSSYIDPGRGQFEAFEALPLFRLSGLHEMSARP